MAVAPAGNSAAAALALARARAAAIARQKAEEAARQRAEAARKRAQAAAQAARAARATATRTQAAATRATTTRTSLQRVAHNSTPAERARLQPKIVKAQAREATLVTRAATAQVAAVAAEQAATIAEDEALTAEKAANVAYKAKGLKEPFPEANRIRDVFEAGRLDPKAREKLFGDKAPVTPEAQYAHAKERIAAAQDQEPLQAASTVERELAGLDPKYRSEVIRDNAPLFQRLAKEGFSEDSDLSEKERTQVFSSLERVAQQLPPRDSYALAAQIGDSIPNPGDWSDDAKDAWKQSIKDGGAVLATQLANGPLRGPDYDNKDRAAAVNQLTSEAINEVREDFTQKADRVDQLNGQLADYVKSFGPGLSPEQVNAAVHAFKKKYDKDYKAFETAGGNLGRLMEGCAVGPHDRSEAGPRGFQSDGRILVGQANVSALSELKRVSQTSAGVAEIGAAVERAGMGQEDALVDALQDTSAWGDTAQKGAEGASTALIRGIGARALQLKLQGGDTTALFDGLKKLSKPLGLDAGTAEALAENLNSFRPGMNQAQAQRFTEAINGNLKELEGKPGGKLAAAQFKGVVVLLGAASLSNNFQSFNGDLADKVKAVATTANLGVDGASVAYDLLGKAAPKFIGPAGLALTSVVEGINAAKAFSRGDVVQGSASSAIAIGSTLIAAGLISESVPVAGTIVGGVLIAAGAAASLIFGGGKSAAQVEEEKTEEGLKTFLKGAGVGDNFADALSDLKSDTHDDIWGNVDWQHYRNIGPALNQLSRYFGVSPENFYREVAQLPKDQIEQLLKKAHELKPAVRRDGVDVYSEGTVPTIEVDKPQTIADVAAWLDQQGIFPGRARTPSDQIYNGPH
jgi:hypothetical protein